MIAKGDLPQRGDGSAADSFAEAMRELRCRPRRTWLDLARQDQSDRWRSGVGVRAEKYFAELPELRADAEESMILICGESQLRGELGADPSLEEFQQRFPELTEELAIQFDVNSIFQTQGRSERFDPYECDQAGDGDHEQVPELPGYEFLSEIGRGASGVVFQARQQSLNRLVAVKILENPGSDAKRSVRQHQEAELLARLQHPHVVHVYEVINHRGHVHLVMELIEGPTLRERSYGRPWKSPDAAELVVTLADTVYAVHEAGILHRDLKPSNVLLTPAGEPKISDFGLAKLRVDDNFLTTQDSILGTPGYMSPEQAIGDAANIGPATDVYSLGAILYELLTGRPPFLGVTILDTLSMIRERDPVSPRQLQPKTPRDLETICLKCLEKHPHGRYSSARELANDLRRFLGGESILARRPTPIERLVRFVRREPAVFAAIALLAALLVVLGVAKWRMSQQELQLSSAALVESVATTDAQALPRLLERIAAQPERVLPQIRSALADAPPQESSWVNLSIAELTADPHASPTDLLEYLPNARAVEIPAIVGVLAVRIAEIESPLWMMLLDDRATDDARMRLACLAAEVSTFDPRFAQVTPAVARALARQHPLDVATFSDALSPARQHLAPALVALIQSSHLEPAARRSALSFVARYASEQVEALVDLSLESEPDEFALIFPALQKQAGKVLPQLRQVVHEDVRIDALAESKKWTSPHELERSFDRAQCRIATAAIALWRLGEPQSAWQELSGKRDPGLRAWIIERLAPLGVPPEGILAHIEETTDAQTRQALVLSLGQAALDEIPSDARRRIVNAVGALYAHDPDAGVHAACRWLLATRLNLTDVLAQIDSELPHEPSAERSWYLGPDNHSFTILNVPKSFKTGSPANELWRETDELPIPNDRDRTIAVSMHEVTVGQYQQFRPWIGDSLYTPFPDCPINNVTWFDAASYCRWLSEREHIPADQMVYPAADQIKPGMKLSENWQDRTGYRLPNEIEWEFACRADTTTSRYCGPGTTLLRHYAWYLNYSDDHSRPVGELKPNQFGLFDILGNVAERCHQQRSTPNSAEVSAASSVTPPTDLHITEAQGTARGGEFADVSQNIRAARVYGVPAQGEWGTVGFRIVRTINVPQVPSE